MSGSPLYKTRRLSSSVSKLSKLMTVLTIVVKPMCNAESAQRPIHLFTAKTLAGLAVDCKTPSEGGGRMLRGSLRACDIEGGVSTKLTPPSDLGRWDGGARATYRLSSRAGVCPQRPIGLAVFRCP
ncbi:hypothetical protein Ct61P_01040 [Colletotrichum tofieldiae]|nr:hypothetical protein Ct61P_01040 [Colletotrichum tofieldiae]